MTYINIKVWQHIRGNDKWVWTDIGKLRVEWVDDHQVKLGGKGGGFILQKVTHNLEWTYFIINLPNGEVRYRVDTRDYERLKRKIDDHSI